VYGESVEVAREFSPYADANVCWRQCEECAATIYDMDLAIASVCAVRTPGYLMGDHHHRAETLASISLSRGRGRWTADIHFDVSGVNYDGQDPDLGLWLPWLQYHFIGPIGEDARNDFQRLTRSANDLVPVLVDNALAIVEYAWQFRKPWGKN
jgi:hypothetical protein